MMVPPISRITSRIGGEEVWRAPSTPDGMDVAARTCFNDCRRESFTVSPCYCATMSGGVERLADTHEKCRRAGASARAALGQRRISESGTVLRGGHRLYLYNPSGLYRLIAMNQAAMTGP